jgi:ATP-dependent Clp protease ATP-binding subunit ClpA
VTVRMSTDVRAVVFPAAKEEAERRGQTRVGTDHLLLALLREPGGVASRTLGIDAEQGRRALAQLDAMALVSVGVHAGELEPSPARRHRRVRFTEGAKSALVRTVNLAKRHEARTITSRDLTAGLVAAEAPDPVVAMLRAAGVDMPTVRRELGVGHRLPP